MAVLYRTNAQSASLEMALGQAGVPHRLASAGRFVDRPEVKVALDALREADRCAPGRPFADLLTDLSAGTAQVEQADRTDRTDRGAPDGSDTDTEDDRDRDTDLDPDDPDNRPGEPAQGGGTERREHLDALLHLGSDYLDAEGGLGSLAGFRAWLDAATRGEGSDPGGDRVDLLTFHKAKGLEWALVCITGLERGLVPISYATTPEARAEEQRLLHVALSRSERHLHLSWAQERTSGLRTARRTASPFLAGIETANTPGAADRRPDPAGQIERIRTTLRTSPAATRDGPRRRGAHSAPDTPLMSALKGWRRDLARATNVPAYVVFSDATLAAVAEALPRTTGDLLTVSGIGPVKVERYGAALLALVSEHSQADTAPTR